MKKVINSGKRHTDTVRTAQYEYTVIFEPAEEGGFIVTVPALPGLHTEGNTFEEARSMAVDAIRGYLECLHEDNEDVPIEHGYPITHRVAINLEKA